MNEVAGPIERDLITRTVGKLDSGTHSLPDGTPDASGKKAPWTERKRDYLAHLVKAPDDVLLVSGCDKLSNARAILDDLVGIGPAVFERFTAKKDGTLWYYDALARIFAERKMPMSLALTETVSKINRLAREP